MGVSYWMIEGVGVDTDKIEPLINKEKLANMLFEQLPEDEELFRVVASKNYNKIDVQDFLNGDPFYNLGDLLSYCDDTGSLTYGDDGEGGSYFYYPPSMPWNRTATEPETLEEVHQRIIKAVQVVTDLTDSEIETMIDDDLYVVGIG